MDPGRAVEQIIQDLALQGDAGFTLPEFWKAAHEIIQQPLDEVFRTAIWRWVTRDWRVTVTNQQGDPIEILDLESPDSLKIEDELVLRTQEEYQWLALTGQPKADSAIGAMAYQLLCAVCRARSAGMSAIELNRATGQDPRSIHGRIAQLAELGLVVRYPVVQNKAHTHLIVYKKYAKQYLASDTGSAGHIDKFQLLKSIVDWCKTGPNHMRLRHDLYLQLEFDKLPRGGPIFNNLLNTGEREGYIVNLNVYESDKPDSLYRCVKYLKDLEEYTGRVDDDEEGEDDDDDTALDNGSVGDRNLDVSKLVVAGSAQVASLKPLVNLIYPLEHQIYDLVHAAGPSGLPAMSLYRQLTGTAFQKPLSRLLDVLLAGDSKKKLTPPHYRYLGFMRGIDFVARMKFYRYFTQITFAQFEKRAADPVWGTMPQRTTAKSATSLQVLSSRESAPLAGAASVLETREGHLMASFHGDKIPVVARVVLSSAKPPPASGKRRGRPPKNAQPTPPGETPPPVQNIKAAEVIAPAERHWRGGTPIDSKQVTPAGPLQLLEASENQILSPETPKTPVVVRESTPAAVPSPEAASTPSRPTTSSPTSSSSLSLAAAKRESEILSIMNEEGGLCIGGISLCKKLEARTEKGQPIIDRKTMEKTVVRMVSAGTVRQVFVTAPQRGIFITRYIIHSPDIPGNDPRIGELKETLVEAIQNPPTPATPARLRTMVEGDISALSTGTNSPRRYRVLASAVKPKGERRRFGPSASEIAQAAAAGSTSREETPAPRSATRPKGSRVKKEPGSSERKRKREAGPDEFEDRGAPIDAERLYRAIIISRSLYPRGANIDWDLIVKDMPGLSQSRVRKRWPAIRDQYGGTKALAKATEKWEQLFLMAYSKSQIRYLDPDAEDFTLQYYVDFWQHHREASLFGDVKRLTTREEFEERYGKVRVYPPTNPLEGVYNLPSMVRVEELMANTAFSSQPLPEFTDNFNVNFTPEEQLVRAVIASDDTEMPPERAADLLSGLGEEKVSEATDSLAAAKVVHYILRSTEKVQPGRNYTLGERVLRTLNSKVDSAFLRSAREFIKSMPSSYHVPSTVEDSTMAVILELASSNDCKLRRKNHTTGRLISDYRSRMIEKQKLDFEIIVELSPSFHKPPLLYDNVPHANQVGVKYLWQFSEPTFRMVELRVLLLIVMRPQIPAALICAQVRGVLTFEETNAVIQWLCDTGRVQEVAGGYVPSRFWFC